MAKPLIPSNEQFAQRRKKLLPPGLAWVWPNVGDRLLLSASPEQQRFRNALNSFLVDTLPQTTINLFSEWLASVSLPDDCSDPSISASYSDILQRLRARGAESVDEYNALFAPAIVIEFFVSRVDTAQVDDELVDDELWQHTWVLAGPEESVGLIYAIADEAHTDDPIDAFSNSFACKAAGEFSAHHLVFIDVLE